VVHALQKWPSHLWLVRHGQSAGNVARDAAETAGLAMIEIAGRDVDVPLSALGERQSRALGRWFAALPDEHRPTVLMSSPYVRAVQTSNLIVEHAGLAADTLIHVIDERLREKEFGSFNRLTKAGIQAQFPQEAQLRAQIGKFYYRPPGGESWCDVILRLRSVLDQIQLQHAGECVLVVAHQVIILAFRYLLERMTEAQILAIDAEKDVANCGVTGYAPSDAASPRSGMQLRMYNFVAALEQAGEPVTKRPDAPAGPR
jgi:broad specificity phosphatase PhoE